MSERSVTHNTFVLERTYDAPVARVFAAFADWKAKKLWFGGPPDWEEVEAHMDFRVGGREVSKGGPKGGRCTPWRRATTTSSPTSGSSTPTRCTWGTSGSRSRCRPSS